MTRGIKRSKTVLEDNSEEWPVDTSVLSNVDLISQLVTGYMDYISSVNKVLAIE